MTDAVPKRRLLIPSPALLWALAALCLLALFSSIYATAQGVFAIAVIALTVLAAVDAVHLLRRPQPKVRRQHAHLLSLGVESEIRVEIENRQALPLRLEVFDHVPPNCLFDDLPQQLIVPPVANAQLRYKLRPMRRGETAFGPVELRLASLGGLWRLRMFPGSPSQVRVYPNFAALRGYALMATDHRLSQLGIVRRRRRGEGLEFHQMREYREGDTPRQIDWKTSSRMRRLVSREYRDERDQQIMLMLDCGRRMHARDGELSHLDHALNAALLLAHVALRQGDAVGLMTFGGVDRYIAPRKSGASLNLLLAQVFDLQTSLSSPDYYNAAVTLMQRQRKRSLVVLISNLRDEDDDDLAPALRLLRQRHLVVLASLRETILGAALTAPIDGLDAALTHAATAQYLDLRRRSFSRLEQGRVPCLDVEPPALPIALINRYTDLKRRGAI